MPIIAVSECTEVLTYCNGLFQKKPRGLRIYFFENPHVIFEFFTLPLENLDKTRLHP